jgi:hypothetical protein
MQRASAWNAYQLLWCPWISKWLSVNNILLREMIVVSSFTYQLYEWKESGIVERTKQRNADDIGQ